MVILVFWLPHFFCSGLKKSWNNFCSSKVNKTNMAIKKQKRNISIVGELHNFWCGDFECAFFIFVLKQIEKFKKPEKKTKKNMKNPITCKASSVTPIWKQLGQGSSMAPLGTTYDTWLPPDQHCARVRPVRLVYILPKPVWTVRLVRPMIPVSEPVKKLLQKRPLKMIQTSKVLKNQ